MGATEPLPAGRGEAIGAGAGRQKMENAVADVVIEAAKSCHPNILHLKIGG